jgi:hypothetical protein
MEKLKNIIKAGMLVNVHFSEVGLLTGIVTQLDTGQLLIGYSDGTFSKLTTILNPNLTYCKLNEVYSLLHSLNNPFDPKYRTLIWSEKTGYTEYANRHLGIVPMGRYIGNLPTLVSVPKQKRK